MTAPPPDPDPSGTTPPADPVARDGFGSRTLLAALFEELARGGVGDVVTSPGSRNVPLLQAACEQATLRTHSVVDERTAGFVALGLAKGSGRPAVLCCTSGTAAAHYLPAVVEAHQARIPLVVVTADRPAELRDVGAGQTIDQMGLFGPAVRWSQELAVDRADTGAVRFVRALAARMLLAAGGDRPGPVHLDVPLREPLAALAGEAAGAAAVAAASADARPGPAPWVRVTGGPRAPDEPTVRRLTALVSEHPRVVVVAGRHDQDPQLGPALAALCELLHLPLLADPLSGARRGPAALAYYDAFLRLGEPTVPRPGLVLRLGDLPTSKPLRRWLAGLPAAVAQVHVSADGAWQDPDGVLSELLVSAPRALLEAFAPRVAHLPLDPEWAREWRALDATTGTAQNAVLDADETPSEPWLARELCALVPPAATLLVASSMPVRDVEATMAPRKAVRVTANRGANGIDGTLATAWGLALAREERDGPVVVLLGDVALRHDVGALLECARAGVDLVVVVVDNDGGGIFSFLPVGSSAEAAVREHVMTPGDLGLPALAAAAGASLREVGATDDLLDALRAAVVEPGVSMLRIRTGREDNLALHRAMESAVRDALVT